MWPPPFEARAPPADMLRRAKPASAEYHLGWMGKASDWLKEERRKTLGDWVAVCVRCGFAQRYFEEFESELPAVCPQCEGELRARCPACHARFSSAFAVECEACGGELRPPELFGTPIRRADRS